MKAYLEVTVIAKTVDGTNVTTSLSQMMLDFNSRDEYEVFAGKLDKYEKGYNFEIYRNLIPIVPLY
nr:MAG TPA: hypothetical protein [Caudoviricetes sp.]